MKCLIPNYTYEPEKMECWLNQKLAEGFSLKKWGLLFVHFEENLSGVQRYQIDVDDNRMEPNCERRNQLSDQGWKYVKTVYDSFHIYSATMPNAEMPFEQSLWREGAKRIGRNSIILGILALFYMAVFLFPLPLWSFWLLEIMRAHWSLVLAYTILFPYIVGKFGFGALRCWRLAKRMMKEQQISGHTSRQALKPADDCKSWWTVGEYVILLLICIPVFMRFSGKLETYENVDQMNPPVKFVDLRQMEEPGFKITEITWKDHPDINFGNRIERKPVLFAKQYYIVDQYGEYGIKEYENVQLSGKYWRVPSDYIAGKLFDQLYQRYVEFEKFGRDGIHVKKLTAPMWKVEREIPEGFVDFAIAVGTEETGPYSTTQIIAQTADHVIYLEYTGATGEAEVKDFVEELQRLFVHTDSWK